MNYTTAMDRARNAGNVANVVTKWASAFDELVGDAYDSAERQDALDYAMCTESARNQLDALKEMIHRAERDLEEMEKLSDENHSTR